MTPSEIESAVELLYSHYNDRLPASGPLKKAALRAWNQFLSDLESADVLDAISRLAVSDTYMPRPGRLRKAVLMANSQHPTPPSGPEAWAQVRYLAEAVSSGTYAEDTYHPCVLATVRQMGGIHAVAVHTNGDRTYFLEAYQERVAEWEKVHYKIVP